MGTVQYNDENGNPIDINYVCKILKVRQYSTKLFVTYKYF